MLERLKGHSRRPTDKSGLCPNICPVVETINMIGTHSRLLVARYLFDGPRGFNEILRMTELSSKTLSITLKYLENQKIVKRDLLDTRPTTVRYSLTNSGLELEPVMNAMADWGRK